MGITKKFLQSMEIPDNKIELIFDEYANAIAGLTADRDKYKEQADKLASVEKELVKAQAKAEELETVSEQLKKVSAEYADYKAGVDADKVKAVKEKAYRQLLQETGISEKAIDKIIKVTDLAGVEIDDKNNVKDKTEIIKNIKNEWSDFIVTQTERGAEVANPPTNTGGSTFEKMSLYDKMIFANEHPDNAEVKNWLS